jgi:hypothetical protein
VRRALRPEDTVDGTPGFTATVNGVPRQAEALGFVDLSQLLALGERAGLTGARAFRAVRDDVRRIRAIGGVVQRQGSDTTAELTLLIS